MMQYFGRLQKIAYAAVFLGVICASIYCGLQPNRDTPDAKTEASATGSNGTSVIEYANPCSKAAAPYSGEANSTNRVKAVVDAETDALTGAIHRMKCRE